MELWIASLCGLLPKGWRDGGPSWIRTSDQGIMSSLLNQYVTDIQGKATVNERKVKLFGISSLAKAKDNTRSWYVYRWCTYDGTDALLITSLCSYSRINLASLSPVRLALAVEFTSHSQTTNTLQPSFS